MVLMAARRLAGIGNRTLAEWIGGKDDSAVMQAMKRACGKIASWRNSMRLSKKKCQRSRCDPTIAKLPLHIRGGTIEAIEGDDLHKIVIFSPSSGAHHQPSQKAESCPMTEKAIPAPACARSAWHSLVAPLACWLLSRD